MYFLFMSMSKKSIMKIRNNYNDYFYYKIPLNADSHKKHNYNLVVKYRRFWNKNKTKHVQTSKPRAETIIQRD